MIRTVVHFKYGGSYVESEDGYRWNSKEPRVYSITFKTPSMDEITYSVLEDMIFKKMGIDRRTAHLKLSHIPFAMGDKFPSYILDDDDVDSYLSSKVETRSFLHVEASNVEIDSSIGLNCEGVNSNVIVNNAITIYKEKGLEEASGNADDDDDDDEDEAADWDSEDEDEFDNKDRDYSEDDGDVEHTTEFEDPFDGNENEYVEQWDDGTGLELNQTFATKFEAQDIIMRAALDKSYEYTICNTDRSRYVVKCRGFGCHWYIRLTKEAKVGKWKVVRYRKNHTCSRAESSTSTSKRRGTVKLVAEYLKRNSPSLMDLPSARSIMASVKKDIGVDVSYWTALRGRRAAEDCVRGNVVETYKILHSYLFMLERVNPGSVTRCVLTDDNKFKYLFVALGACIEGFGAMRKVLQVDATFLKTGRGGVLVFATAQDPNHHHYPIAFAVLDGENDPSWNWFFTQMRTIVEDDPELVWISDRNSSLIKGIHNLYPRAQHGFCMFHLSLNIRAQPVGNNVKESCAKKFRELATIYTEAEFLREYEEFGRVYPKGREYLETSVPEGPEKWARCYFPGERFNINTTNSSESINNVFKDARKNSLLVMIDKIIEKIAEWFNKHRKEAASMSGANARKLVPFVENELSTRCTAANKLHVDELNSFLLEYNVIGKDGKPYFVDLRKKSCSCRSFDIDKYPCGEKRRKTSNRYVPNQNLAHLLGVNDMAGNSSDAS